VKKILLMGMVLVSCLFCINVNAEDFVWNEDFALDISNTLIVQEYNENSTNGSQGSYIHINVQTNNEAFGNLTGYGISNLGNYYYSVNGGEYVKETDKDKFSGDDLKIYFDDIDAVMDITNEIEVKVYFESADQTVKSEVETVNILIVQDSYDIDLTLKDEKTGIVLEPKFDMPYGTVLTVEEVTDSATLSAMKLSNPTAWKIRLTAFGKNIKYYDDKYGATDDSSGMVWGVNVTLPVPSKYNYSDNLDVLAQFVSSDFKIKDTVTDADNIDKTDYSKYVVSVFNADYLSDYYLVLSDSVEFNYGEEDKGSTTPAEKDETVESPTTGIEDYALYILGGLVIAVTSITLINRNKKFKRI